MFLLPGLLYSKEVVILRAVRSAVSCKLAGRVSFHTVQRSSGCVRRVSQSSSLPESSGERVS